MNERLETLRNHVEWIMENSTDKMDLLAGTVAEMLTCLPNINCAEQTMGLDKAVEDIDCISRNLGESNHLVIILREMHALVSMSMV